LRVKKLCHNRAFFAWHIAIGINFIDAQEKREGKKRKWKEKYIQIKFARAFSAFVASQEQHIVDN
jgi:hypothetical protein